MKVKALIDVTDYETRKIHKKGTMFELDDARARAGIENGFLKEVTEKITKVAPAE